jgi:hypothetical protein
MFGGFLECLFSGAEKLVHLRVSGTQFIALSEF